MGKSRDGIYYYNIITYIYIYIMYISGPLSIVQLFAQFYIGPASQNSWEASCIIFALPIGLLLRRK